MDKELKFEILKKEVYLLISKWSDFDTNRRHREYYINELFPTGLSGELSDFPNYEKDIFMRIRQLLRELSLTDYSAIQILQKATTYTKLAREGYIRVVERKEKEEKQRAERESWVELERENAKREEEKRRKKQEIRNLIENFHFKEAEELFKQLTIFHEDEFLELKAKAVRDWFSKTVMENGKPYLLDEEQVFAIVDENQNTLVKARAGSGKTRVIVAKIIYLVEIQKQKFEDIVVFAFNKSTPKEINERLKQIKVKGQPFCGIDLCRTFHSQALEILKKRNTDAGWMILGGDKSKGDEKARYIQAIIERKKNREPNFTERIYKFFREESFQIGHIKGISDAQYYQYLKNQKYSTLDGKIVKSIAEKYIADYLFEHGIKYEYEKEFYPGQISVDQIQFSEEKQKDCKKFLNEYKGATKPDFYLSDYDLVWEHWAITGRESYREQKEITESGVIGDYKEYLKNKTWKQRFWGPWRCYLAGVDKWERQIKQVRGLIQTVKLKNSRKEFEELIERKLIEVGITPIKRDERDIIAEVWSIALKKFPSMITSFIDRYQQKYLGKERLFEREKDKNKAQGRVYSFISLGKEIYDEYVDALKNQECIIDNKCHNRDFNQIIYEAAQLLKQKKKRINGLEKKYILIDEYQDFSELFFNFISALRSTVEDSILFCVGDDWQLINRFAGSDPYYFSNFETIFQNSSVLKIQTNYRCDKGIIEHSNQFMEKIFGASGARPFNSNQGLVKPVKICSWFAGEYDRLSKKYRLLYPNNISKQNYLFFLTSIIYNNWKSNTPPNNGESDTPPTFLLLHRNNEFKSERIEDFLDNLRKIVTSANIINREDFNRRVNISTVHRSKGLQADIVVLLDINEGIIPMMHPDNVLYEIFGETLEENFKDQARLYYVALTRAKHKLYIMFDEKHKSGFLS